MIARIQESQNSVTGSTSSVEASNFRSQEQDRDAARQNSARREPSILQQPKGMERIRSRSPIVRDEEGETDGSLGTGPQFGLIINVACCHKNVPRGRSRASQYPPDRKIRITVDCSE